MVQFAGTVEAYDDVAFRSCCAAGSPTISHLDNRINYDENCQHPHLALIRAILMRGDVLLEQFEVPPYVRTHCVEAPFDFQSNCSSTCPNETLTGPQCNLESDLNVCYDASTFFSTTPAELIPEDDPLSLSAVSISGVKQPRQNRVSDAYFDAPRQVRQAGNPMLQPMVPTQPFAHPEGFARDLLATPALNGLALDQLQDHPLLIRTWYLHHQVYPRWKVPRIVELDNHWEQWMNELQTSWRDMIDPAETFQCHIVTPDPMRTYVRAQAIADVIVTQGNELGMFAGLLTVEPLACHAIQHPFALAISLPGFVSGRLIVSAADLDTECDELQCELFFGWDHLPLTEQPMHLMSNGHGFLARIRDSIPDASSFMQVVPSRPMSHNEMDAPEWYPPPGGHAEQPADWDIPSDSPDSENTNSDDDFDEQDYDHDPPQEGDPNRDRQSALLFHLAEVPLHTMLFWTHYDGLMSEVAQHYGIQREELLDCHELVTKPKDIPDGTIPLIVQQIYDIPIGDRAVLVLLDIEIHGQAGEPHFALAPRLDRKVIAVPIQLTRFALLMKAEVFDYCRLEHHRCLVQLNHVPWNHQHAWPHQMNYGDYIRIMLPPPRHCTATTAEVLLDSRQLPIDDLWSRHYIPSSPSAVSSEENVSPSLIGSDDIRAEFGQRDEGSSAHDHDAFSSMQMSSTGASSSNAQHSTPATTFSLHDACLMNPRGQAVWPHWYRALTTAFDDTAITEDEDEGRVAYFDTWYADCRVESMDETSRPVRLDTRRDLWAEDLRRIWIDRLQIEAPTFIAWVTPTPVPSPRTRSSGHLILFQFPEVGNVPFLLTYQFLALNVEGFSHAVLVTDPMAEPLHITQLARMERTCRGRRCTLHRGAVGAEWGTPILVDLEDASLDIAFLFVRPTPACSPLDQVHILLIQQPEPHTCGTVITTYDSSVNQGRPFSAAAFVPNQATRERIIRAAHRGRACIDQNAGAHCRTWFEGTEIHDTFSFPTQPGQNFNLHIHHPFVGNWDGTHEDLAMMQLYHQIRHAPHDAGVSADPFVPETPPDPVSDPVGDPATQQSSLRLDLHPAIATFEWLDSHFTLLSFVCPDLVRVPVVSREWLDLPIWDFCRVAHEIRIYFDGSYLPTAGKAGLACAIFIASEGLWYNAGFMSASIDGSDSYVAELRAAIATAKAIYDTLKIVATMQTDLPEVWIGFDSLTVGNQLLGHWQCRQHPLLGRCLRMLIDLVETRFCIRCHGWHIRSHQGEPGNEFVDALAAAAAEGSATHDLSAFFLQMTNPSFIDAGEWIWMLFSEEYADKWEGHHVLLPQKPTTTPHIELLPTTLDHSSAEVPGQLWLRLATANVLTLKGQIDTKHGVVSGPTRQTTLLQQLHDDGVHVFAFQETRLRKQHSLTDPHYLLFSSAATEAGHFGMLLGFSTYHAHGQMQTPSRRDSKVCFRSDHFAIIAANPRLLIVRVRTPVLRCIVIAAHAPHSGASEQELETWWTSVTASIPAKYDNWERLVCVDANARVGQFPSDHVGDWQAEEDTPKSEFFLDFLQQHHLWLPSTFEASQIGRGGTWRHNNGKWLRNDFIALPLAWSHCLTQAFVNANVDVSTVKEDHAVATVTVSMPVDCLRAHRRKSSVKRLEKDVHLVQSWRLDRPFRIDWNVDVHTHADQLQAFLLDAIPSTPKRPKPLRSTMTAFTWALVREKRFWRNQLWQSNQEANRLWLKACFDSWRNSECAYPIPETRALVRQQDMLCATAYGQFRHLGRQVVRAIRADDVTFFSNLAQQAGELTNPHQARAFWQVIRRSLPKFRARRSGPSPMQLECLEDQWHPYFQALEVGSTIDPGQLVQECHAHQMDQLVDESVCPLGAIPSMNQIAEAFRDTQAHKATGLDPLPAGFLHAFPVQIAKLCMSLFIKVFVWQMEPIQGKGGILAVIPKKTDFSIASNFRGIMLLPSIFKRLHALLRKQLIAVIAPLKPAGQIGGFGGQQVQFGSMALQCLSRIAKTQQLSMGVVFVDLANAFHRLVRELVCGIARADDVQSLLNSLSSDSCAGVKKWLELPCLLTRLGAPERLIRLLRDVHSHTWHVLSAYPGLTRTRRGTRPGSPLADVVFHVIMLDVTIELNTWVSAQTAFQEILQQLDIDMEAIVWSDDLAIPWLTKHAQDLPPAIERLLQQIYKMFARRGFDLNMQKRKTSAVLTFRGAGAPDLRRKYQLVCPSGMPCQLSATKSSWLHIVPAYKHLGTVFAADGGFQTELYHRIGQAKSSFTALARPVLCNRHLPAQVRLRLFHTLVGTKLFFGLGSWPSPSGKHLQSLNSFLVSCLRRILGLARFSDAVRTTDAQVFAQARCLDARARIAQDRLLLAQKLFQHGPAFVHHLLHREFAFHMDSWMHGVMADLRWLHALDPAAVPVGWTTDLTEPIDFWQSGGPGWKSLLKRLGRKHILQESMMADVVYWHRQFFHVLMHAGATFSPSPFATGLSTNVPDHQCFCGRTFTTAVGLATHQRKQHNMVSPEHELLSGATCPACLKHFWSTQRLQQHLAYVSRRTGRNECFQTLKGAGYQVEYDRVGMPRELRGLDRANWVDTSGPSALFPNKRVCEIAQCEEELFSLQSELQIEASPEAAEDLQAQLYVTWNRQTHSWFDSCDRCEPDPQQLQDLEDRWIQTLCDEDVIYDPWLEHCFRTCGRDELPVVLDSFEDGAVAALVDEAFATLVSKLPSDALHRRRTFLQARIQMLLTLDPEVPHRPIRWSVPARARQLQLVDVPMSFEQQTDWHDALREVSWCDLPPDQPIPRLVRGQGLHFVVAHLFSGRRRIHDVHWWLSKWADQRGVALTVLSLDTAVSSECGNLCADTISWTRLTELYSQGAISASLSGAPCETYSAARHLVPSTLDTRRWPRPLRSAARLFGLSGLTMRELRQCKQGTAFSLQTLLVAAYHLVYGGLFLSEHPARPEDPAKASIWSAAITQLLVALPDCALSVFPQWKWGSATPKPTGLLSLRLPTLAKSMYSCADPALPYPTTVAQGIDGDGHFNTSKCKEYPPLFCRALATALTDRFEHAIRFGGLRTCTVENEELQQWLRNAALESSQIFTFTSFRPDFQGLFVAVLSMCLLSQRYSMFQLLALLGVFVAVVIGILPSFESDSSGSNPFFAVLLGGSCIFNAVAFVVKELIFTRYKTWRADQDLQGGTGLNIFLINSHEAVFQLPLTLMLIPLNDLLKQSSEGSSWSYLKEAMTCVFSGEADACGPDAKHGELAGLCVLVYVVFNLLWNMGILLSVKHTGALATFVALKAIFPVSTVLFEYVDWPLLGKKDFSWLIWLSMAILLPSIACYQRASQLQAARAAIHPSLASCCWPWGRKTSNLESEMMLG
eukprot:s972_g8.t1